MELQLVRNGAADLRGAEEIAHQSGVPYGLLGPHNIDVGIRRTYELFVAEER
jgi:hypothetical protein